MPYFFSYVLKNALRIAEAMDPPDWLTTICAGLGGSCATAEAAPVTAAAPARPIAWRRRIFPRAMTFPFIVVPRETLGANTKGSKGNAVVTKKPGDRVDHRAFFVLDRRFMRRVHVALFTPILAALTTSHAGVVTLGICHTGKAGNGRERD